MSIAHSMRSAARDIFLHALSEASIDKAFDRHVHYQRGVLRVCDDLYDLKSYSRVVSIVFWQSGASHGGDSGSPGWTQRWRESSWIPTSILTSFPDIAILPGGHPQPNEESVRGAEGDSENAGRAERAVAGHLSDKRRRLGGGGKAGGCRNHAA